MNIGDNLQKRIMLRIYAIWLIRRVAPVLFFEILFMILAAHLFGTSVFVAQVLENAGNVLKGGILNIFKFAFLAFVNARLEVKFEIFVALIMGALFIWSIKRAVVSYEMIRRGMSSLKK